MQEFINKHPWLARLARVRMADWLVTALVLWAVVAVVAPHQVTVSVYKMALVAIAAVAGYWIDRSLFPYARPDLFFDQAQDKLGTAARETHFTDLGGALSFSEEQTAKQLEAATLEQVLRLGALAMVRRAVIVGATMVSVSLGA